jgi:hypothetical protein
MRCEQSRGERTAVSTRQGNNGETRESGNAAVEVPPGFPDRDAYVSDIAGLTEQFSDFAEDMFQRGAAEETGELDKH